MKVLDELQVGYMVTEHACGYSLIKDQQHDILFNRISGHGQLFEHQTCQVLNIINYKYSTIVAYCKD